MSQSVNPQNFYEMLNRFTTSQLEELTKQHPFQHELHLLLAKKYQLEKNPAFDEQLQLAAIYAQDRELFFSLFNEAIPALEEVGQELYKDTTSEVESIGEEIFTSTTKPEHEVITSEESTTQADTFSEHQKPIIASEEETVPSTEQAIERTFEEWLKIYRQPQQPVVVTTEEQQEAAPVSEEDDELEKLIMQNTPVDFLHELVKEETHYSKGLDEFIEQEIKKKKQPEWKKSASENEIEPEMVTETLAKLYEMQKKYARAIKAYQALALKYPEKNDFFAARINYLKNLI
jgi:hypothetical protein